MRWQQFSARNVTNPEECKAIVELRDEMEKKHLSAIKESLESVLTGISLSLERKPSIGFYIKVSREELGSYEGSIFFRYDKYDSYSPTVTGIGLTLDSPASESRLNRIGRSYKFDFDTMTCGSTNRIAATIQERFDCIREIKEIRERKLSEVREVVSVGAELLDAAGYKTKVTPMHQETSLLFTIFRKESTSRLITFTVRGNRTYPRFSSRSRGSSGFVIKATLANLISVVEATNTLRTIMDTK